MFTLEDMLIARGEQDRVWRGLTGLHLWRGVTKDDTRANPLYPDLEPRKLPSGKIRNADVTRYFDQKTRKWMVKAEIQKGTSTVDREGIFGQGNWNYTLIPKGTFIPHDLIITKDFFMAKYNCWHYTLSPNYDMEIEKYLQALDPLARNAEAQRKTRKNA